MLYRFAFEGCPREIFVRPRGEAFREPRGYERYDASAAELPTLPRGAQRLLDTAEEVGARWQLDVLRMPDQVPQYTLQVGKDGTTYSHSWRGSRQWTYGQTQPLKKTLDLLYKARCG